MSDVTQILQQIEQGDPVAAEQLLPLVYDELRRLATARMAQESPDHTLQATALVHEAWLRLVGVDRAQHWDSRGHFFGAAAEAMRRILVENARRKKRVRHGGGLQRLDLDDVDVMQHGPDGRILALDAALAEFETVEPEKAELVKLRFFVGLSIDEAADLLQVSRATAKRNWVYARAWLLAKVSQLENSGE